MKTKDQILLEEAYKSVLLENEMTPQQERQYSIYRDFGWEFSHWEDGSIVMNRWDYGADSTKKLATMVLKPNGDAERS